MKNFKAVLFDVDDTLVDDTASWRLAVDGISCALAADPLGRPVPASAIATAYATASDELWSDYERLLHPLGSDDRIRERVWEETFARLGWRVKPAHLRAVVADFASRRLLAIEPDPRLIEALTRLSCNYRLAICSNGRTPVQRAKLDRLGVSHLFPTMACGQDDNIRKPAPEIFLRCVQSLAADPSDCLHIGDDWELDVVGARAAGLTAAWIDNSADDRSLPSGVLRFVDVQQAVKTLI